MSQDWFTSVPAKGAIMRDWPGGTIVLDLKNGIGENFHFEIEHVRPSDKVNLPPKSGDTSFGGKCQLDVILPIAVKNAT